jgi:hypothetical protein
MTKLGDKIDDSTVDTEGNVENGKRSLVQG